MNSRLKIIARLTDKFPPDFDWDMYLGSNPSVRKLFEGIRQNVVANDRDAKEKLFAEQSDSVFYVTKHRLLKQVVGAFAGFDMDKDGLSSRAVNEKQCRRKQIVAMHLLAIGDRQSAMDMIRTKGGMYFETVKYGFTDLVVWCLERMISERSVNGEAGKVMKLVDELKTYSAILHAESITRTHLAIAQAIARESSQPSRKLIDMVISGRNSARALLLQAVELSPNYCNYNIRSSYHLIELLYAELKGDQWLMLQTLDSWVEYIKKNKHLLKPGTQFARLDQMSKLYYQRGEFDQAVEYAKASLIHTKQGSQHWRIGNQRLFLGLMHAGRTEEASTIAIAMYSKFSGKFQSDDETVFWKAAILSSEVFLDSSGRSAEFGQIVNQIEQSGFDSVFKHGIKDRFGCNLALIPLEHILLLETLSSEQRNKNARRNYRNFVDKVERLHEKIRIENVKSRNGYLVKVQMIILQEAPNPAALEILLARTIDALSDVSVVGVYKRDSTEFIAAEAAIELIGKLTVSVYHQTIVGG